MAPRARHSCRDDDDLRDPRAPARLRGPPCNENGGQRIRSPVFVSSLRVVAHDSAGAGRRWHRRVHLDCGDEEIGWTCRCNSRRTGLRESDWSCSLDVHASRIDEGWVNPIASADRTRIAMQVHAGESMSRTWRLTSVATLVCAGCASTTQGLSDAHARAARIAGGAFEARMEIGPEDYSTRDSLSRVAGKHCFFLRGKGKFARPGYSAIICVSQSGEAVDYSPGE